MKNKKRKSIGGEERFLRVVYALSVFMRWMIGIIMWVCLLYLNYHDAISWRSDAWMFAGLLAFIFWHWLGSMASELLEYEQD